jgi:hypothetical protein
MGGEPTPGPLKPKAITLQPLGGSPTQPTGPIRYGTLHFQTNLGSLKSLDGEGKFEMDFKGTVMVSHFKGSTPPQFTGNLRLQFSGHDRVVYFGTGHMAIEGKWRAIQWFGTNLKGVWNGYGIIRLVGEFDKNLNTGTYYYDDPTEVKYWQTSIVPIWVPEPRSQTMEPRERKVESVPKP